MSASLRFMQHGFGAEVTGVADPAVVVFEEGGEPHRARSVSVKNTGSTRALILVNVSVIPAELANQFINLHPIAIEPGDAFTFQPHPVEGPAFKNVGYRVDDTNLGSGAATTLVIAAF